MIGIPEEFSRTTRKLPNKPVRTIALLTSGGDAPGMNAAIRGVVRYALARKIKILGVARGYSGLIEGELYPMDRSSVANIIQRGGTVLKTSRCPEFLKRSGRAEAGRVLTRNDVDALVVIGGDGSFAGAHLLENETRTRVIGIPGTIDNDIAGSDDTIGFDTAINTALDAIDKIRDTANSHDRLFLVEVMGRNSGFLAASVGISGGAETIVLPSKADPRTNQLQHLARSVERGIARGKSSSIIVCAEGPKPGFTQRLAAGLEKRGFSPRVCILGHIQRGGTPTAHDRFLASAMGAVSVEYLIRGFSNCMIGVQAGKLARVPLSAVHSHKKPFPKQIHDLIEVLAT